MAKKLSVSSHPMTKAELTKALKPVFGMITQQQGGTAKNIDGLVSQMTGPGVGQGPGSGSNVVPGSGAPTQMGPGLPPQNMPLGSDPRQWGYRVGWNLPGLPGEGRVAYQTLHDVAHTEWLTRKAIEIRKNQISNMKLDIVAKDRRSTSEAQNTLKENESLIAEVKKFFIKPDGRHSFHDWLSPQIEDHLVYDGVALEKVRNLDPDAGPTNPETGDHLGKLIALEHVDSSTIKALLDDGGRQPLPPLWAYQQYLYGVPRSAFSSQEMIYAVKNIQNDTPYGFSSVEQFLFMVNIVLRYWAYVGAKYTDGTLPEGVGEVPANWTTAQIAELNDLWDSMLAGDPRALRKLHFVPGGFKWHQFKDTLFDEKFARLLIEMTAIAFDVTPQEMGFTTQGKGTQVGGKSQGESAQELAQRRGPQPLMDWIIRSILNPILWEEFGGDDLEWVVIDESKLAEEDHARAYDTSIRDAAMSLDQVIVENGGAPVGVGRVFVVGNMVLGENDLKTISGPGGWPEFQAKMTKAMAAANPAPLVPPGSPNGQPTKGMQGIPTRSNGPHSGSGPGGPSNPHVEPEQGTNNARQMVDQKGDTHFDFPQGFPKKVADPLSEEARLFERKAIKAVKSGKSAAVKFHSEYIPDGMIESVREDLKDAKTVDDVKTTFTKMDKFTAVVKVQNAVESELKERENANVSA